MKSRAAILPVLFALFLSGFASLLLEVVWVRRAHVVTGTTTAATTLVLSVFMTGLALGNAIARRLIRSVRRPFGAYALCEGVTALLALSAAFVNRGWGDSVDPSWWVIAMLLLAPTTLMGMTIPFVVDGFSALGRSGTVAVVYAVNTLGGAAGAGLAAYFLLPKWGLFQCQMISCGLLLLSIALVAHWISFAKTEAHSKTSEIQSGISPVRSMDWICMAFWGGASALAMEVVWTRLLSLVLGPSVYALGAVLTVYLFAIALGARWITHLRLKEGMELPLLFGGLAVSIVWSVVAVGLLPYIYVILVDWIHPAPSYLHAIEFFLSLLTIAPTAFGHGVLIPLLVRGKKSSPEGEGEIAASVLAWNTFGAIVGTASAGLWLIPQFGLLSTTLGVFGGHLLFFMLSLEGVKSVRIVTRRVAISIAVVIGILFLGVAPKCWDRGVLTAGVYKYAVGDLLRGGEGRIGVGKILYYREGASSTVAVIETSDDRVLSVDGKADATAKGDRSTQVLLGALPASLSDDVREVLVIGFASGVTSGVSALFPNTRVTSVDIEPAVYEASEFFLEVNHGPLLPPHRKIVGDARHYLFRTKNSFDVITSEPSNPWMSGVAPLFTKEFFSLAKSRLAPGGVMCQWLPIYGMSQEMVASVMHTFFQVFKYGYLFESVEGYDLLLLGAHHDLSLDPVRAESRWENRDLRVELSNIGITSGEEMIGRFIMGRTGAERFSSAAKTNTDDNGVLEFGAPKSLHLKTAERNHRELAFASEGIADYIQADVWTSTRVKKLERAFSRRGKDHDRLRLGK